jgi:hypothetical protein
MTGRPDGQPHAGRCCRYLECMTVRRLVGRPAAASLGRGSARLRGRLQTLLRTRARRGRVARRPGVPAPRRPPRRPTATLGGGTAALGRRPVAFAGLDPVAAAVGRPPGPAPGHWLQAVGRAGLAVVGDQAEAAARQWGEGFSVIGRSWHGGRIRKGDGGARPVAPCRSRGPAKVGRSSSSRVGSRRKDSRACSPAAAWRSPPFRRLARVGTVRGAPPGSRAGRHVGTGRVGLALQQADQVSLQRAQAVQLGADLHQVLP